MITFALVTLVYNKEKHLNECLNSVKRQSRNDFFHFIVNDGSTDNSHQIISEFSKSVGNVIYYNFPDNKGQMPRYNYVLRKINKLYPNIKLMGHLDADDMLVPSAINDMIKHFNKLKNTKVGHVSSYFSIINGEGAVKHAIGRSFPILSNRQEWKHAQAGNNLFGHFRVMRIDLLNKIGGFDESFKYATDYNMSCRMLDQYDVGVYPKVLYLWRQHGGQIEKHVGAEQTQCWKDLQKYYKKRWNIK